MFYAVALLMFANVTKVLFIAFETVAPEPIEAIVALATVAVTVPVTAVDTEAIGIVLKAGCPEFAILARTVNLPVNSWRVSVRELSVV